MPTARASTHPAPQAGPNTNPGAGPAPDEPTPLRLVADPEAAAALSHRARRSILAALGPDGDSAAGVARQLGLPRQQVNYHLRELERVGLAEQIGERKKGNCLERVVRARASTFAIDPALLGDLAPDPARQPDRFSAYTLIALASRTIRELAELLGRSERAGKPLSTLSIDTSVRFRDQRAQAEFAERLARTVAELAAEFHDETAESGRTFRVTAGVYQAITKPEEPEQHEAGSPATDSDKGGTP